MRRWTARLAVSAPSALGEGPLWDGRNDRLLWVDITSGVVHSYTPKSGTTISVALGQEVAFVTGHAEGGYLAGTASGFLRLDDDLQPCGATVAPPDLDSTRRINDGACDSEGRVVFGTVDPSGAATGSLWSWSGGNGFLPLAHGVQMSNGVGFSPDGAWLYFVDSMTGWLDRFAYDPRSGHASRREHLFRVPTGAGLPDGLAVDAQGCIWLAIWGAGAVWRLTPDGRHDGVVEVGAARTTSCAFGGPGRDRLYITTARDGTSALDAADRDLAPGALFVADVGVRGAWVWTSTTATEEAWAG